jgi:hypothetical protein
MDVSSNTGSSVITHPMQRCAPATTRFKSESETSIKFHTERSASCIMRVFGCGSAESGSNGAACDRLPSPNLQIDRNTSTARNQQFEA